MSMKKKYMIMISVTCSVFLILLLSIKGFVTADTNSNQIDVTQTTSLSSEEVDAILKDIQSAESNEDIMNMLDELIKKATLTGNSSLKQYAEYMKQYYELKSEMDDVSASINTLLANDNNLKKVDTQIKEAASINISYDSVSGILSESALAVLSGVSENSWSTLSESLVKVENIQQKLADTSLISYEDGKLIEILLLNCAINNNLIDSNQVSIAQEAISNALISLSIAERSKYSEDDYSKLCSDSSRFGDYANKANSAVPEQVIMFNQSFKLNNALIMYDNKLLISIEDILQFINANVQYTDDSATISILSENKLLEITRGTNIAYVNDKSTNIDVPVLNISGKNYLSVEFFATTYEVGYEYIDSQNTIILYSNLNQN